MPIWSTTFLTELREYATTWGKTQIFHLPSSLTIDLSPIREISLWDSAGAKSAIIRLKEWLDELREGKTSLFNSGKGRKCIFPQMVAYPFKTVDFDNSW